MLLSVEESDYQEVLSLAKRFYDLGIALYATGGTAEAIGSLGIPVTAVANATDAIKAAADLITLSNEDDGVMRVLRETFPDALR